jgi:hypothetical protein
VDERSCIEISKVTNIYAQEPVGREEGDSEEASD